MKVSLVTVIMVVAVMAIAAFGGSSTAGLTADNLTFEARLSGDQEVFAVSPAGTGTVTAEFDEAFTQVAVELEVAGLSGLPTGAHFHCARAGANGPIILDLFSPGPLTFVGGQLQGTLTNADITGPVIPACSPNAVNNMASLAFAMRDGDIYVNVHTAANPPGEIRGQLLPEE